MTQHSDEDFLMYYEFDDVVEGVKLGDIDVLGRQLRSYQPDEFTSFEECDAFEKAVWRAVPVAMHLQQIMGDEWANTFFDRRNEFAKPLLAQAEAQRVAIAISTVLGVDAQYEILQQFQLDTIHSYHGDSDYYVVRHDGAVKYLGSTYGSLREIEREDVERELANKQAEVLALTQALSFS